MDGGAQVRVGGGGVRGMIGADSGGCLGSAVFVAPSIVGCI